MLPPFIIEQLREREEQARKQEQPHLELPLEPRMPPRSHRSENENGDRGVVEIQLWG